MITLRPHTNNSLKIANRVCERIQERFPYISPTRVLRENYDVVLKDNDLKTKLQIKQLFIQKARSERTALANSPVEFYKHLINDTDKIQALNCAEYVYLSYLGLRLNGINTAAHAVKPVTVQNGRMIDHALLKFKDKDSIKNIFMDTWLGIYGTGEKIKELYYKKFANVFSLVPNEKIEFQKNITLFLNEDDAEELRKFIPELDLNI